MKYKFSLLAPHPDDEFIGCRKLLERYGHNISCIVFITNGERNPNHFSDPIKYATQRRKESEDWIKTVAPNCYIHYLNVPDGFSFKKDTYFVDIFNQTNDKDIVSFLIDKTKNIVGEDIIIMPNIDAHPTHTLTHQIGMLLNNKKIFYHINTILNLYVERKGGVYTKTIKVVNHNLYNYAYIYSYASWQQRNKDFARYYPSQYHSFVMSSILLGNMEFYISSVPLKLYEQSRTFSWDDLQIPQFNIANKIPSFVSDVFNEDFGEQDEPL